ncbi:MAG: adenylate/guanylate cyclase domain-containing protein [Nocardioides sp.]|nr:adenylate/guanylate cyclase domain-containing protein [Nocardioides sp.]
MELPVVGEVGVAVVVAAVLGVLWATSTGLLIAARVQLARSRARARRLTAQLEDQGRRPPRNVAERAVKVAVSTVAKVRDHGVSSLVLSSIDDLTRWALEDRAEIAKVAAPDGTVTVLFSDVESSTAMNEELGDTAWVRLLEAHDALVRAQVDRHHGHVVKSQGDGFMVVFGDPADAVSAAIGVQRALGSARGRRLRRHPIRVRLGMHTGPTISRDGDYFGRSVAFAARVAARADGGQVLVSDAVRDALPDEHGYVLEDLGEVGLKGLQGEHRLWAVDWSAP